MPALPFVKMIAIKKDQCFILVFFTWLIIPLFSCNTAVDQKQYIIGFSQCTGGDYWRQTMLSEMKRELAFHENTKFIYKDAEDNSNKQIEQVRQLLKNNIDLLIISPNEAVPLTPIVEEIYNKGIPVIVIDRKITSPLYTSYIGANNYEVVYIFDVNTETPGELEAAVALISEKNKNYLLVGNKTDLAGDEMAAKKFAGEDVLYISAKEQFHINLLKQKLVDKVIQGNLNTENTIITNARHYEALQEVQHSLQAIKTGLDNHISGDLLALDIRRCLHYISEITGDVSNEDVLDYIFSKFCIGK